MHRQILPTPPATPSRVVSSPSSTSVSNSSSSRSPSSSRFRIKAQKFFLTYSQCASPAKLVQENFFIRFPDTLEVLIVATETHADGLPHLHIFFSLSCPLESRNVAIFDDLAQGLHHGRSYPPHHPQIQFPPVRRPFRLLFQPRSSALHPAPAHTTAEALS